MIINLNDRIAEHYKRVENLAKEAAEDEEQTYSSRAAAMTAVSSMLRDLKKDQEELINMERLMQIEQITIDTVKEFLTPDQIEVFLGRLEERVENLNAS